MILNRFTYLLGLVFLAIGILGFFPGFVTEPSMMAPRLIVTADNGLLFALFPVNLVLNLLHIALGLGALYASSEMRTAKKFCQICSVLYALLALAGFVAQGNVNTLFGISPLYGNNIWLHALVAVTVGYFGFIWGEKRVFSGTPRPTH
jgi:hypothetical protein